jgi:short-subunit dehydrogenase
MSDSTPSYFKFVPDEPVRRAKTAIVTGASSGIGLELAKKLSLNGYRVVVNSRRITSAPPGESQVSYAVDIATNRKSH